MPKEIGYVGRVYMCFQLSVHGPFGLAGLDAYELLVSNSAWSWCWKMASHADHCPCCQQLGGDTSHGCHRGDVAHHQR